MQCRVVFQCRAVRLHINKDWQIICTRLVLLIIFFVYAKLLKLIELINNRLAWKNDVKVNINQ